MRWEPPPAFEEFRLVRPLGAGTMGQVFLAHDTLLDRAVAIKFISAVEIGAKARERFFVEARAVARLSHPNVVAVHRVGEVKQRPYLVSEYVPGTSLAAIAKPVPWERALKIAIGLARGLASAHRRGVLHRDIKPANVVLGDDDEAKLLDFGLAKLVGDTAGQMIARGTGSLRPLARTHPPEVDATTSVVGSPAEPQPPTALEAEVNELTADGAIVGTPLYLAPELWRGEPASRRTDIYALGVVLYELLAGRAPHAGLGYDALADHVQAREAAPIATVVASLPKRLAELVDACVHRDPERRPESSDALGELLEAVVPPVVAPGLDSPYRGLAAFEPEHRVVFFGRGDETRAIVERLRTETFIVVAGDSGAGKSSLCRAAVIPAFVEKSHGWRTVTVLPGPRPRARLDAALALATPGENLLLFIDQLEELLTVSDPAEAAEVAERLAELVVTGSQVRVLASARSDFLGRLAGLPGLGELVGRALFLLGPLSDRGLHDAIVGPARALGYEYAAPETVDELIASGRRHLPLLQFTLAALWDARDDALRTIPAHALAQIGGVAGALARRADQVMATLGDVDREIAWQVLVRLMTAEGTRAVVARAELGDAAHDPEAVARVIERLVGARLVVVAAEGDDRVEVVHEALFTGWPRLVEWRRTHEQGARMRDQLADAARQWRDRGEPRGLLWRDDALLEYRLWRRRWTEPLTAAERRFGDASEADARRVWRIRLGLVAGAIAAIAVVIVMLVRADRRAEVERAAAELQNRTLLVQQGQQQLEAGYGGRALAYFADVLARGGDTPALHFLIGRAAWSAGHQRTVLAREPRGHAGFAASRGGLVATSERGGHLRVFAADRTLVLDVETGLDGVLAPAFTPDERSLVAIGSDWHIHVWDLATRATHAIAIPHVGGPAVQAPNVNLDVVDVAISRDGRRIAVLERDLVAGVFDLASGALVTTLAPEPSATPRSPMFLRCVAFSGDGERVLVGDEDGAIAVWSLAEARVIATLHGEPGKCRIRVAPDGGRTYVASGTKVFIWEALAGDPVAVLGGHVADITAIDLRADGGELVTASADGTAKRWDTHSARLLGELAPSPRRELAGVHYDARGERVVTVGSDGLFRIWEAATSGQLMVIEPAAASGTASHAPSGAFDAAFTRDGIVTASGVDVIDWEVAVESLIAKLPHAKAVYTVRFSPDDRRVVAAGVAEAGVAEVELREDDRVRTRMVLPATAWDAAWDPDGTQFVIVGNDAMARVYDRDGLALGSLVGHTGAVNHVAFSHDATRIATAGADHTARIWDTASRRELRSLVHPAHVMAAVWMRDGRRLVTATYAGELRVWDTTTGTVLAEMGDAEQILDVTPSPDETELLVAGHDNIASIWDLASRTRVRSLVGHGGPVTGAIWSPDGGLVATTDDNGGARVWDPRTGTLLAMFAMPRETMGIEWSHDGKRIAAAGTDGVTLWDVRADTRSLDELRAFMAARVSWQLVDGQLVAR